MQELQRPKQGYKFIRYYGKYEEIPDEWKLTTVGKECLVNSGSTPSRTHPEYFEGDLPWVSSGELNYGIIFDTTEHITMTAAKKTNLRMLPKGTFLIAITGLEAIGTRGRCAILGVDATTNQSCIAFHNSDRINTEFLFYFYQQFSERIISSLAQGTKQQSLNLELVKSIKFPLRQIKEQKKIVNILSKVDSLIEKTDQIIGQTQRLKKGLMQKLLTKGIGHTKFKAAKFAKNPYQLSVIPEEWDYIELGKEGSGEFINGLNKEKGDYGHGCLHVNIDNIFYDFTIDIERLGRVNATEEEIVRYSLKKGDICLLRSSVKAEGVGYPALFNSDVKTVVFSGFIIRFRPDPQCWNSKFLTYLLRSFFVRQNVVAWATVSANVNINQGSLRKLPIPHPQLDEQQKIASVLSNIDSQIQIQRNLKFQMGGLKQGLMQKLLTGKIRVKV